MEREMGQGCGEGKLQSRPTFVSDSHLMLSAFAPVDQLRKKPLLKTWITELHEDFQLI